MCSKVLLESMERFALLGLRSGIAFVFLLICFSGEMKRTRMQDVKGGVMLGAAFFTVMTLELTGLRYNTSGAASLEENTAVIFVPIFMALIRRKLPERKAIVTAVMAIAGVALLCFKPEGFSVGIGDIFCVAAAMVYACAIILISKVDRFADPLLAGVYQVLTMAVLSFIASFIFESPSLPGTVREWGLLLYLAMVCSGFGFTLQPFAQKGTTPEKAGTMCALSPVTAAVLGTVFLGETLTLKGIAGAVLIVASIII